MRRPLALGALSACLLFPACSGDDDASAPTGAGDTVTVVVTETVATTTDTSSTTESDSALEVTATLGDTLDLANPDGTQISVTPLQVVDPAPHDPSVGPAQGMRVVAVRVRIENSGGSAYSDTPGSGAALLTAAQEPFLTGLTPMTGCPDLGSPTLNPGEKVTGCLTFDVPKGTELTYFTLTSYAGFTPEADRGFWRLAD